MTHLDPSYFNDAYNELTSMAATPEEENAAIEVFVQSLDVDKAKEALLEHRKKERDKAKKRKRRTGVDGAIAPLQELMELSYSSDPCIPQELLNGLTDRDARIWQLRAEGMSHREIALTLGVTKDTVRSVLQRIAENLRKIVT